LSSTCVLALVAFPAATIPLRAADAVQVKSGTVSVGSPVSLSGGAFEIAGTRDFSYTGGAEGGTSEGDCGPCAAGDTISLTTELRGTYFGTATYQGKDYELDISNGSGSFTFTSPRFVLPETTAGEDVAIEQPFELTDSSLTLPDGTQVSVDGGGVATARFSTFEDAGQTLYFLEDITFTFEK
jgi:hypothetical protein